MDNDRWMYEHHLKSFNDFVRRLPFILALQLNVKRENLDVKFSRSLIPLGEVIDTSETYTFGVHLQKLQPPCASVAFKLPLMVGSELDLALRGDGPAQLADPAMGGYFYIGGNRYIFVSQMDTATDRIKVARTNTGEYMATFRPSDSLLLAQSGTKRTIGTMALSAKCVSESLGSWEVSVKLPTRSAPIPDVAHLLVALAGRNVSLEEWIHEDDSDAVFMTIRSIFNRGVPTLADAVARLAERLNISPQAWPTFVKQNLLNSHVLGIAMSDQHREMEMKYGMALEMVRKLAKVISGDAACDNRDSCEFMNVILPGQLMAQTLVKAMEEKSATYDAKKLEAVQSSVIERMKIGALKIRGSKLLTGVTGLMDSSNPIATISHLRRVVLTLASNAASYSNITGPRHTKELSFGRFCVVETPSSELCGLTLNLAASARISTDKDYEQHACQVACKVDESASVRGRVACFVDGMFVCKTEQDGQQLAASLRAFVESMSLPMASVCYRPEPLCELHVQLAPGRVMRPVVICRDGVQRLLDPMEEASMPKGSFEDVTSYGFLGVPASMVAFIDHNQAARNTYVMSNMKQAMACMMPMPMFTQPREARPNDEQVYAQLPVVVSKAMFDIESCMRRGATAIGCNKIIAIITSEGDNMEDSVAFKRSSLEAFTTVNNSVHCHSDPTQCVVVKPGDVLHSGSPICMPLPEYSGDRSALGPSYPKIPKMAPPGSDSAVVTDVMVGSGESHTRVMIQCRRVPEKGDKMASIHGQKFTIGKIVEDIDMPISAQTGLSPDILINPHSFPTRMTIGLLMELVAGKSAAIRGSRAVVHQCKQGQTVESKMGEAFETLRRHGYQEGGREILVCGKTGRMYETTIMVGTGYILRLKHMASNKVHARSQRADKQDMDRNPLTRQPNQGGGLKFGEMEVWAAMAHGAHDALHGIMSTGEDMVEITIDEKTGALLPFEGAGRRVRVPQAFRLFLSELMAMHISITNKK